MRFFGGLTPTYSFPEAVVESSKIMFTSGSVQKTEAYFWFPAHTQIPQQIDRYRTLLGQTTLIFFSEKKRKSDGKVCPVAFDFRET